MQPIGLTMGDPSGIGPEVILKALVLLDARARRSEASAHSIRKAASQDSTGAPSIIVYGDPAVFAREAARQRLPIDRLTLVPTSSLPDDHPQGHDLASSGEAAWQAIRAAIADVQVGRTGAIVTAPISKAAMNLAGHHYPGHTEILAEAAGNVPVRMMLANPELKVVLVSIHEPLRRAVESLSTAAIVETIRLTDAFLRRTGTPSPRIAVAGLNPHAGEAGLLGDEEIRLIAPAIAACRADGIDASGPHAPDTVFMRARGGGTFDVVIAQYHDQGLIPIKYLGLDAGVNITIGLPFIRTSPDHGTAYDLVGKGVADPSSLLAAIDAATILQSGAAHARFPQ